MNSSTILRRLSFVFAFLACQFTPDTSRADLIRWQEIFDEESATWCDQITEWVGFGQRIALGDFNRDGFDDLLVGDDSDIYQVFLGTANGLDDSSQPQEIYGGDACVADINHDGYDDAIFGRNDAVDINYGSPAGLGAENFWIDLRVTETGIRVASSGDLDGDGIDDFVVGWPYEPEPFAVVFHGFDHLAASAPRGPFPILFQEFLDVEAYAGDTNGDGYAERIYQLKDSPQAEPIVEVRVGSGAPHRMVWGQNGYGVLGDGTSTPRTTPTRILTDTDWKTVSLGSEHTVAIKLEGSLWSWGRNIEGQLGDGTTGSSFSPVQVGSALNWTVARTASKTSFGLRDDGTLWGWGWNTVGQIGDGTTTNRNAPVQIGADSDWAGVYPCWDHTLAIRTDGALWAWGDNIHGQLGDNSYVQRNSPVPIGFDTDWVGAGGGDAHSIALKNDGTLWAWGNNDGYQLGDDTTDPRITPEQVGWDDDWVRADSGIWSSYNIALKSDGSLWIWGSPAALTGGAQVPTMIGSDTDWVDIAAGFDHFLARKSDRTLWAMGYNQQGQLGDGTTTDRLDAPVPVAGDLDWKAVTAGYFTGMGLGADTQDPWTIVYDPSTTTRFGEVVASAGDINADGYDDIAVTDPGHDGGPSEGLGWWGRVYIWYGGQATAGDPSGLGADPTPASAEILGAGPGSSWARSLAAGDVDGDGYDDLAVGDEGAVQYCYLTEQYVVMGTVTLYDSDVSSYIVVDPEPGIPVPWHLDGPIGFAHDGNGYELLSDMPLGSYTLTWGELAGWVVRGSNPVTRSLAGGSSITFQSTFVFCPTSGILYVDQAAVGTGYGTSWEHAVPTLRDALDQASTCGSISEIWVAAGTYWPLSGTRNAAFNMTIDGLAIYGGFNGTESSRSERDPVANVAILSGDIGVIGDPTDNSYHVVDARSVGRSSVLDGFTITGGYAESGNGTDSGSGGGLINRVGTSPTLANLIFVDNYAEISGGGMWSDRHCYPRIENVVFTGNSTAGIGGGMYNDYKDPELVNVAFLSNSASLGGGFYNGSGNPMLVNVVFYGNTASADGGGFYNTGFSNAPVLANASFSNNSADGRGGAIFNDGASIPVLKNSILWDNVASEAGNEVFNSSTGMPTISYSLVEGCGGSGGGWQPPVGTDGGGNIDDNPGFKGVHSPFDPLTVWSYSPVIDAGDNSAVPVGVATDIRGNARFWGGSTVDMGAYEHQGSPTGVTDDPQQLSDAFAVYQNVPNPFNPVTTIRFDLPKPAIVEVVVYDVSGRLVRTLVASERMTAGPHDVVWNGRSESGRIAAAGVYFYRLEAGAFSETKRMTLVK